MTGNQPPPEAPARVGFGMTPPGRDAAGRGAPADDTPDGGEQEILPDDARVDLGKEREATGIDEVFEALDTDLVGLTPVKTRIREIAALLLVDRARSQFGLATSRPNLHMSFTGSPGTGKTTVALRMADLLHRLGYLRRG
ncbi:MAG: CbbX protein, partial [Pseudonocardiaceae bacterium]